MKIIPKVTLVVDEGKTSLPGEAYDMPDADEAQSLIDRGLAELPPETEPAAEAKPAKSKQG